MPTCSLTVALLLPPHQAMLLAGRWAIPVKINWINAAINAAVNNFFHCKSFKYMV